MKMRPGNHDDELISASLTGDLSEAEQAELDRHLAECARCRDTLAAFSEERRLISGMRHVAAPRDLGARVRAGIESAATPWWRRPGLLVGIGASLATVTAAVLAVVVLGDLVRQPVASTGSPQESASVGASIAATASPSSGETVAPTPSPPGIAPEAIPPYYLAYAGPADNLAFTLRDGDQGTTERELPTPPGQPIRAALSPDRRWLAYITPVGQKGTNKYWVANTEDGTHVELGESSAIGSPFTNGLFWATDSRYLTFTLTDDLQGPETDAWAFDATDQSVRQLTRRGDAVAAGWRPYEGGESRPWVSVAIADPYSFEVPDVAAALADDHDGTKLAEGIFQPVWNWDGSAAIFWRGTLDRSAEAGYEFAAGGAPYLARNAGANPSRAFDNATLLFSDVSVGREAFTSAAVTWGAGTGDAYAVWDARWSGPPQSGGGSPYPDENRIYFSHGSDERNILAGHALDAADLPDDAYVSSVAIAPLDTDYLAITVGFPVAGDLAMPEGEVLLIKRNTGSVPDELVRTLKGKQQGWYGPAVYP
jgi:hypothetical protein